MLWVSTDMSIAALTVEKEANKSIDLIVFRFAPLSYGGRVSLLFEQTSYPSIRWCYGVKDSLGMYAAKSNVLSHKRRKNVDAMRAW